MHADAIALVSAVIDIDGMQTNGELNAFIEQFRDTLPRLVGASPGALRAAKTFRGARTHLHDTTAVFDAIVSRDVSTGSARVYDYIDAAVELMHRVTTLDDHASAVELEAIETFASLLRGAASERGVDRATQRSSTPALPDLLAELHSLIGLDHVKGRIHDLVDLLRVRTLRAEVGLSKPVLSHHLVFVGNPGTGKTTIARLYGQLLLALGVLESGHLVEVDRADLVAGYVGQTAARVDAVVERALGGILLIDEAHGLVRGDDSYGIEAIDALVKRMEDHRGELVVVATGYPGEMDLLLDSNPGLRSRFGRIIHFADYADTELAAIFGVIATGANYILADAATAAVDDRIAGWPRQAGFGNGRAARQLFEDLVVAHARRVARLEAPDRAALTTIVVDDVAALG